MIYKNKLHYLFFSLIFIAGILTIVLSRARFISLPFLAQDIFTAKANNLNGLMLRLEATSSLSTSGVLSIYDLSDSTPIATKTINFKDGNTVKFKFNKRISNSLGRQFRTVFQSLETGHNKVLIAPFYSLNVLEAIPFLLYNHSQNKPFPLNQKWIYVASIILYLMASFMIFHTILWIWKNYYNES